ncbi:MAG: transglutaminase domain-containing protein [Myxococcaceae bacterium]|nr:transglutaminase domain-containing protein [Myxococcaceae bacterium]
MPTIQNAALKSIASDLAARRTADPQAKASPEVLNKILTLVGTKAGTSPDQLSTSLNDGRITPEQKLNMVKCNLDLGETADLKTLISDPQIAPMFDATATNFLKALVGLETLRADGFKPAGQAAPASTVTLAPDAAAAAAVRKMRELVQNGQLQRYYDAAIGQGDPALKDVALKLFNDLPKLNSSATADELVAAGLWTAKPKGIDEMTKSARFLPGRQVLVETTVHSNVFDDRNFLSFKEGGVKAKTYRATIAGEKGDNFLIKVDGKNDPIEVPKSKVFEANQPHVFEGDKVRIYKTADYTSPFMKAKIAEAAIKMDALVQKIDFTKAEVKTSGGGLSRIFGGGDSQKVSELQRQAVKIIHDVIDMKYPSGNVYSEPGRDSGQDAGRLAVRGIGMCYEQASVMAAMLNPFRQALGVDVQFISGGVYRDVRSADQNPFNGGGHGWLQLTYRPSMELRICDRTWNQSDHPADRAYSRWGDRYPASNYGGNVQKVADTDVDVSGKVTVATFDRQFGVQGQDGRDNHQSKTQ